MKYTLDNFNKDTNLLGEQIIKANINYKSLYPIMRGGLPVAMALSQQLQIPIMENLYTEEGLPDPRVLIVDDVVDSGTTQKKYIGWDFACIHLKKESPPFPKYFVHIIRPTDWIEYFWEKNKTSGEDEIIRLLQIIGENPNREGLLETPKRFLSSWNFLFSGYKQNSQDIFKTFSTPSGYDEIIMLKDVEMYSTCLAGSTFVETPKGRIPINRLQNDAWVYCWDMQANKMTLAQAKNPRVTGTNQQLWRVYSDKDTVLCTGNHKFLTYEKGWVKAKDLQPGESIVALNKGVIVENGKARCYLSRQFWDGEEKQMPEHRFVYSEINGEINSSVHIHHVNNQPNDNSPENLKSLTQSEHSRLHRLQEEKTGFALFSEEQRQSYKIKQIEGIKRSQTTSVKKQRATSLKKYWCSLSAEEKEKRNHKILYVEKTQWYEDVWCMDIPKYHNFVANGMVVHNCEHHILPFFGKAHIAYIPNEKVIGISKLARLLDIYSRRLQIQERLCQQITEDIMKYLQPKGAACIIEAQHLCMKMRGVEKQNSTMITSSLKGVFLENSSSREELMRLIR